jgi:hypothetical protein
MKASREIELRQPMPRRADRRAMAHKGLDSAGE